MRKFFLKLKQLWAYGKVLPEVDSRSQYIIFDGTGVPREFCICDGMADAARWHSKRVGLNGVFFAVANRADPASITMYSTVTRVEDGAIMVGRVEDTGQEWFERIRNLDGEQE